MKSQKIKEEIALKSYMQARKKNVKIQTKQDNDARTQLS